MYDVKSLFASRTVLTNIVIGLVGLSTALGLLPEACSAENVAAGLGVAVPTVVGSAIAILASISTYFRVKATATLV